MWPWSCFFVIKLGFQVKNQLSHINVEICTNLADTIEAILLEALIIEGHSVGPDVERLPGVHPGERVGNL